MIRNACIVLLGVFFLLPAGCAVLDPGPPMTNVILPVRYPELAPGERMPIQLLVARPAADSSTSSDRILALMNGYEVRALDSAKWVGTIPSIVQRKLVDALEASRRFAAVGWEETNFDEKYRLSTDIRQFYLRYDEAGKAPVVDMAFVYSLVKTDTGKIIARKLVQVEVPCTGNSLEAFVTAFGRAMTETLAVSVDWVVAQLEARQAEETRKK